MMKVTKSVLPYILGFFFGVVLSFFQEEMKKMNSAWDFWNFYNSIKFVFPFMFMVLLISVGTDVTAFGWEKTKKNISSRIAVFQRERRSNFFPKVFQDKEILSLSVVCPKDSFLYSTTNYSIEYRKKDINLDAKTKKDLYASMLNQELNTIKASFWFKSDDAKVWKNKKTSFSLFEFDDDDNVFYLFRKSGKPKKFWNDEHYPKLEEMSFGFGEYNFLLNILATDFLGRSFSQTHKFLLRYDSNGIEIIQ